MMNRIYRTLLLCTLVGCSSCGRDGVYVPLPLDVSAEVGSVRTRADDIHASDYDKREFVAGDIIRIAKTGASSGVNYKRTATGAWTPVDEATPMTTTGGEKFTATFPSDFSGILSDQRTATNFWKSNQLSAAATAQGNRASFTFVPAACKITVIIIYEANNDAQGTTLTGKGLCSGNKSQDESILLLQTNGSDNKLRHTYAGIFSPGAAIPYTITMKASTFDATGKSYVENDTGLTLKAGTEYQYTFTATSELILNSVVVKDFAKDPDWNGTDDEENAGNAT